MSKENTQKDTTIIVAEKIKKLKNITAYKQQFRLIEEIAEIGVIGEQSLMKLLIERSQTDKFHPELIDGLLFQLLNKTIFQETQRALYKYFKNGLIELDENLKIDYQSLHDLLLHEKFQEADQLTQIHLCKLAGIDKNNKRNWLYFTDISSLPLEDLYIIDRMWQLYSKGKFGFSVQRKIWVANNSNWEQLWHKIGWKKAGIASRYPNEFIWNLSAPSGHLPLFNQLRGVQVIYALFNHINWT